MAKKRKSLRSDEPQGPAELDPKDSRKRIKTFQDVADSDDEFHLNQDEVLLGEDPQSKRRRKWAEQEEFLQPSDEEVLGYSDGEEDEDETANVGDERDLDSGSSEEEGHAHDRDDEEDDGMGWGTSKDALYGADAIETEEQALEEEAEALRLQKKQLQSMSAGDYGFDDDDWQQDKPADEAIGSDNNVVTEVLPQLQISPDLGSVERLKLLKSRYPEFELLSKDMLDIKEIHAALLAQSQESRTVQTKLRAASAYMGALVLYFSLFTSSASKDNGTQPAVAAAQLREHPIMNCLVQTRESWHRISQLPDDDELEMVDVADESSLDSDASEAGEQMTDAALAARQVRKSRAQRHAEAVQAAADERRAERLKRTEADLADLDSLVVLSTKRKSSRAARANANHDDSDLGEEEPLTAQEAADKAKKKKSLRFYTSQIAQKANKRSAAGRNAGGDDDIPYRERLKDRQARLNAEAEKRGHRGADIGDNLGDESDEEDRRQAQQIRADADEDDYYDLVAARAAKKKSDKAALSEAQRQAALQGGRVVEEAIVGPDGKRKISYAIEKNKGLTPHRKKDVRNPRVKKRKRFEEKKKKLASIKPVYKGGEGRGGYGGELTGIKKGLVKSTKL